MSVEAHPTRQHVETALIALACLAYMLAILASVAWLGRYMVLGDTCR